MSRTIGRVAAIAVFLIAQATLASAAEIKVFSTIGVQAALEELTPKFEKASGHKLTISWGTAAILVKRVQSGETADLMVLTRQSLDALTKEGKASADTDATFASSGMAMVVKKGAPKPDIGTVEKFKEALLAAKSVAYIDPASGGSSGIYVDKLLVKLGIADQIKPKAKLKQGGHVADLIVSGEAELGIHQISEIVPVKGVTLIGPLLRIRSRTTDPCSNSNQGGRSDLAMMIWVTLLACAKLMMSSAMRRPTPGMVSASPPSASASRKVSASRSRCSSVNCRLRRVSMLTAVQGACSRSASRLV